ncbi:hypothetical protein GH714_020529 [Hevea brasiliensis]|uniref:Uncharacterized protein n=1 Tax=Hevea brasiliensis TaxID=3981 RepID=A0A6A6LLK7_HEVBR|nr:hypothetical protein GH714_020529 [Hevea brasiliensis]
MYTLEDRSDFSPESGIPDYPLSPEIKSDPRTPFQSSGRDFMTPVKSKSEASASFALMSSHQNQQGSASSAWWSPTKASSSEQEDKGKGSPVEGVVQPGALITLPPPREVARPEMQRNCLPAGNLDEEEWVTVYGFYKVVNDISLVSFSLQLNHFAFYNDAILLVTVVELKSLNILLTIIASNHFSAILLKSSRALEETHFKGKQTYEMSNA